MIFSNLNLCKILMKWNFLKNDPKREKKEIVKGTVE